MTTWRWPLASIHTSSSVHSCNLHLWHTSPGVKGWTPQTPVSELWPEIVTVSSSWLVGGQAPGCCHIHRSWFFLKNLCWGRRRLCGPGPEWAERQDGTWRQGCTGGGGSSGNPCRILVLNYACLEAFTSLHFTGKSPVPSLLLHLALFFMNNHLGPGDMVQRPKVHISLSEHQSSGLKTPYNSRYRRPKTLFWPVPAPAPLRHLVTQTHTYKWKQKPAESRQQLGFFSMPLNNV